MAKRGTVYIRGTSIRLLFDDALTVPNETHSYSNEVVNQVLEDGSQLADHIIILQDELEVQLFVSNSVPQKSQDVYSALKTLRNKRELCKVYTDHEIYSNMAIESVSAPHEAPNVNIITFTVKFKRVDWTNDVNNRYPLAKFIAPLVPEMQSLSNSLSEIGYKKEQVQRVQEGLQLAKNGNLGSPLDIDTSAVSTGDMGELTPMNNEQNPANLIILSLAEKIADRNDYDREVLADFLQGYTGNIVITGSENLASISVDGQPSLEDIFAVIFGNIQFVPSLLTTPMTFNITVEGQVIQFDLIYNQLLNCWKGGLKDAVGNRIIENMTLMAGANCINGLNLKYQSLDPNGEIIEEDLVLKGLYVTEPTDGKSEVFEKGAESSKYAFIENETGVPACSLCYFTDEFASNTYKKYINEIKSEPEAIYDELGDYEVSVV